MRPTARPSVQKLAPYVPGRPIEEVEASYGITGAVKLASNENPLGPSPLALEAARGVLSESHRYPDGSGTVLRRALAERHGVSPDEVVLGAGSCELIDIVIRAYVDPGDEVVVPEGIFRMFPVAVGRAAGAFVEVPTRPGFVPDVEAMLARVGPRTKVVALANPNNPTGAYLDGTGLRALLSGLPPHVLVLLDEAYHEFAIDTPGYPDGLVEMKAGRDVVVLRTFSKIHGLAALRIGYAFAPLEVAGAMNKVREPFNTTSDAQAAALAALDDVPHRERTKALVVEERAFLTAELGRRGLVVHPSLGNFLLVDFPRPFGPLEPEIARRGVIVRPMAGWGFPMSCRVSVGRHDENLRLLAVLDELVEAGLLGGAGVVSAVAVP